jgi:oxidoreductase
MTLFSYIGLTAQLCIILILIYIQFSLVEIEQDYKPLNMIKLDPKTITVGIIGYTGETGKALSKEILSKNIFKSASLIGRRLVNDEDYLKNGTQVVVDFENLDSYTDAFKQDVIYCCLGTTRGKSGVDGFKKVDYDYIVNSAKVAKKNGCKQFHLVSSSGADKNSFLLYPKIKGESEDEITKLEFEKLSIYRPKFLVAEHGRTENRLGERIALFLTTPFKYLFPQLIHTPIDKLVKSMIRNTINFDQEKKTEIIENSKIFDLASKYDKNEA